MNYPPEKDDQKKSAKKNRTIPLKFLYAKKVFILPMFETIIQIIKNKFLLCELFSLFCNKKQT